MKMAMSYVKGQGGTAFFMVMVRRWWTDILDSSAPLRCAALRMTGTGALRSECGTGAQNDRDGALRCVQNDRDGGAALRSE